MAKKRKTREQKRLADSRHSFIHGYTPANPVSVNLASTNLNKFEAKSITIPQNSYPFLKKDLSKTAILTFAILAFQIILFFALKNHLFSIAGLTY